jgi:hypothetical protein
LLCSCLFLANKQLFPFSFLLIFFSHINVLNTIIYYSTWKYTESVYIWGSVRVFSKCNLSSVWLRVSKVYKHDGPHHLLEVGSRLWKSNFFLLFARWTTIASSGTTKKHSKLPLYPLLFPLIHFTLTTTAITQDNHHYYYTTHKNDHHNVSFFSFICHWFLHNYRKKKKEQEQPPLLYILQISSIWT